MRYIKSDYDATLPSDMLYAPDGGANMVRDYFRGRSEEDRVAKEEAAKRAEMQAKIDELKSKYPEGTIQEATAAEAPLEYLFDLTVPGSGNCDSVGGEIVRAMMRILYRDYNDGDKFFEGYGKETCLPAVAFIIEKLPFTYDEFANTAETRDDDQYTRELEAISRSIVDSLTSENIELFWTPNDEDMFDSDISPYEDWEPLDYAYDGNFPDSLIEAMFDDKVSEYEVEAAVEEALAFEDINYEYLTVGEYGWSVEGLTLDDYERLQDMGDNIGSFVEDDLEIASLYEEDEDEDEDDDY